MFGKKKIQLKQEFDELLLKDIDQAFAAWNTAKHNQENIYEADEELAAKTKAAKAQYELLFREARLRRVKGHLQASIISR
ncbi:hypothetical protein LFYK43_19730 [Ligilactobacillus salitolerans]|uniref:DUF2508 domain-containing protein n=1 Tax=Ligilactobacillus salitolerans TaxID=1808352 RepID=A0A401IVE8_9LACO|nr:YaaL family protein [Ligilactobacillus salitolerans]GBG95514.1 hypothetical protein LFYK43_19730 [Ligilactobacillus salitolerans]